jgi:hypothetical protein
VIQDEHFDQISPLDGVHQLNPDGTVTPALTEEPGEAAPIEVAHPPVEHVDPETGEPYAVLLDDGPPGEPATTTPAVAQPSLPPSYDDDFQLSVTEQLEQQRAALAQPAANVDIHGAPHFMRMIDGEEMCGQCGEPFPCPSWIELSESAQSAQLPTAESSMRLPTMEEAARAAGVDLTTFVERLRATRGL